MKIRFNDADVVIGIETLRGAADFMHALADSLENQTRGPETAREKLMDALDEGTVYVVFRTQDGRNRTMTCTRKNHGWEDTTDGPVVVYDEEKCAVRSFKIDTIISAMNADGIILRRDESGYLVF